MNPPSIPLRCFTAELITGIPMSLRKSPDDKKLTSPVPQTARRHFGTGAPLSVRRSTFEEGCICLEDARVRLEDARACRGSEMASSPNITKGRGPILRAARENGV